MTLSTTSLDSATDAELILRTCDGSDSAYAELFTRHRGVALGVARRLAGPDDADDIMSEAFVKVLSALRQGGGPAELFRPYLLTTVRNVHLNRIRATKRESLVGEFDEGKHGLIVDDGTNSLLDNNAVTRAFSALPERWRTVLWLSAVEGWSNHEIAAELDLKPNAVAALSFRAREGLREAFMADHVMAPRQAECRRFTELLPGYVRGTITPRRSALVHEHVEHCLQCSAAVAELRSVEGRFAGLLLPALCLPAFGFLGHGVHLVRAAIAKVSSVTSASVLGGAAVSVAVIGLGVGPVERPTLPEPTPETTSISAAPAPRPQSSRPGGRVATVPSVSGPAAVVKPIGSASNDSAEPSDTVAVTKPEAPAEVAPEPQSPTALRRTSQVEVTEAGMPGFYWVRVPALARNSDPVLLALTGGQSLVNWVIPSPGWTCINQFTISGSGTRKASCRQFGSTTHPILVHVTGPATMTVTPPAGADGAAAPSSTLLPLF